jgi:hypothetical protein
MLIKTSKESIKNTLEYLVKIPFAKNLLHKITESARGKCIVYFSLHRVLEDSPTHVAHPHFLNRTAITLKEAQRQLSYINHRLPFISIADSLEYLLGKRPMNRSFAVLLIEVPYVQTIRKLSGLLEELKIPAAVAINTESIEDGRMPWMDEIVFRLGHTNKQTLSVNFIDRSFTLNSMAERLSAAEHLIHYLSQSTPDVLKTRVEHLCQSLAEVAIPPVSERICTIPQLEKLSLNPLFSFICAGKSRLPLLNISLDDAKKEIIDAQYELKNWLNRSVMPIYFCQFAFDKRRYKDLVGLMMDHNYVAAISPQKGLCRPGDNMFRLRRLSLAAGLKSFEQFELQGLSDAIDEMLLVTLAKNKSSGE